MLWRRRAGHDLAPGQRCSVPSQPLALMYTGARREGGSLRAGAAARPCQHWLEAERHTLSLSPSLQLAPPLPVMPNMWEGGAAGGCWLRLCTHSSRC